MPMKNPPHPGGFVLRQCIETARLDHHSSRRCPWCHSHHSLRARQTENAASLPEMAVRLSKVFRRQPRILAHPTGPLRPRPPPHHPHQTQTPSIRLIAPVTHSSQSSIPASRTTLHPPKAGRLRNVPRSSPDRFASDSCRGQPLETNRAGRSVRAGPPAPVWFFLRHTYCFLPSRLNSYVWFRSTGNPHGATPRLRCELQRE